MTELATPQPGYRALMMFDRIPDGCIAFPCTDLHSLPHIRPGEWVVVDTHDTLPRNGEVYVIQWQNGRRVICQAHRRPSRAFNAAPGAHDWFVAGLSNPRSRAATDAIVAAYAAGQLSMHELGWSDGPFVDDDGYLQSKLVGVVIGLYCAPEAGQ